MKTLQLNIKNIVSQVTVLFLLMTSGLNAQDYYYYGSQRIAIEKRNDKLAVILNTHTLSKQQVTGILKSMVSFNDEVRQGKDDFYLIYFGTAKSEGEILSYSSRLSNSSLVKTVVPVYFGESERVSAIATDEFVVSLKNIKDKTKLDILNLRNDVRIIAGISNERGFVLKTIDGVKNGAMELSRIYYESGIFEYSEPNFMYPDYCLMNSDPNDEFYSSQWALRNTGQSVPTGGSAAAGDRINVSGIENCDMDVDLAWNITSGSSSVTIGVFDSGIDSTHPDFENQLVTGYDATTNKYGVATDYDGHGTNCAGIIGARRSNGIGTSGVAPGCYIMAFRLSDINGMTSDVWQSRAFDTARVKGVSVISCSWGASLQSALLDNAINNAATNGRNGKGCIILFSSGNNGRSYPEYPSRLSGVFSVGATTQFDQKKAPGTGNQFWWGGNYGESGGYDLDVCAPTVCYTTDIQGSGGNNKTPGDAGNYYSTFNGTSCSCPNAAAVAALILSVNLNYTKAQVMEFLARGCDKIDKDAYSINKPYGKWNSYLGYGRVNANNSVRLAFGYDVTPPTINHKMILSHSSTYPSLVTAEIVDQNGGDVNPDSAKIIFRRNIDNAGWTAFDTLRKSSKLGNDYTFSLPCAGYQTEFEYYISAVDLAGNKALFPRNAPNQQKLCYFAVGSIEVEKRRIGSCPIPDKSNIFSPVANFPNFTVLDTKAQIFVRHQMVNDLTIILYSPNGNPDINRVCLFSKNPANSSIFTNISGAAVSDSANLYWYNVIPPYTAAFVKPEYLLRAYTGTEAGGDWKAIIRDDSNGIGGTLDSIVLSFQRLSGTKSSCCRLDSPADSTLVLGAIAPPTPAVADFYLKNAGTSDLNTGGVTFSGTHADNFELISPLPGAIAPGDSGLFRVRFTLINAANNSKFINSDASAFEQGVMRILTNDPSKPVFNVTMQTINQIGNKKLYLDLFLEGHYRYNNITVGDTIRVYLRQKDSPYSVLDSSKNFLDTDGESIAQFANAGLNNYNYYISIKHRSAVETWSATPTGFFAGVGSYNFKTAAAQAFGNNQRQLQPGIFGFYNGDVNQDGVVDIGDLIGVYNNAGFFTTGYVPEDVNYSGNVDLSDILLVYNNARSFIAKVTP